MAGLAALLLGCLRRLFLDRLGGLALCRLLRSVGVDMNRGGLDLALGAGQDLFNPLLILLDHLLFNSLKAFEFLLVLLVDGRIAELLDLGELGGQALLFLLDEVLGGVDLAVELLGSFTVLAAAAETVAAPVFVSFLALGALRRTIGSGDGAGMRDALRSANAGLATRAKPQTRIAKRIRFPPNGRDAGPRRACPRFLL